MTSADLCFRCVAGTSSLLRHLRGLSGTLDDLRYLDEKHTIFGEVAEGYEVVEKISDAFVDENGQPWQNIRFANIECDF